MTDLYCFVDIEMFADIFNWVVSLIVSLDSRTIISKKLLSCAPLSLTAIILLVLLPVNSLSGTIFIE